MVQLDNCVKYFSRLILTELKPICNTWVAGGCVRDYFSKGKLTSDIDLFFTNAVDFEKCSDYLLNATTRKIERVEPATMPDADDKIIIETIDKPLAKKIFENDNVLKVSYNGKVYDVIKKYFEGPEAAISKFDFTVCCAAVDLEKVYTHETFFIDLAKRQLMINELPFPLSTMWRMQKYIKKGYYMCSGEMLKLSKAIGELQTNRKEGEQAAVEQDLAYDDDDIRFSTFD